MGLCEGFWLGRADGEAEGPVEGGELGVCVLVGECDGANVAEGAPLG